MTHTLHCFEVRYNTILFNRLNLGRCNYPSVLRKLITIIVNYVLSVIQEGMGQLRIVPGGLQLLGQALVLDSLFASSIKSRRGQPISIESSRNFTVSTRDALGMLQSRLFLGEIFLDKRNWLVTSCTWVRTWYYGKIVYFSIYQS